MAKRGKFCMKCKQPYRRGDAWMGVNGLTLHMTCPGQTKTNLELAAERREKENENAKDKT